MKYYVNGYKNLRVVGNFKDDYRIYSTKSRTSHHNFRFLKPSWCLYTGMLNRAFSLFRMESLEQGCGIFMNEYGKKIKKSFSVRNLNISFPI